ncbi:MAG: NfeD family protein [Betaproteobacteria bacterium]|nr:NfeD family protein [Betaproteobacteria bacterium]
MDDTVAWLIAGFVLVIAEMATGTFFLLVLGIAAFAGAGVAYAGFGFPLQSLVAAALAVAGVILAQRYRKRAATPPMAGLDVGRPAVFQSWVDRSTGQARVKYRDALWDAVVSGDAAGEPGEILVITSVDGNTLKVSKNRSA